MADSKYTGDCVPTIIAAFHGIHGNEVALSLTTFNKRRGGTRIYWTSPAQTVNKALGFTGASDVLIHPDKKGTTAQVAKTLSDGCYMVIHRGHAYGLIVTGRKAYTVDYKSSGNAARRQVWTVTKMEGVCPVEMLEKAEKGLAARTQGNGGFSGLGYTKPAEVGVTVYTEDMVKHYIDTAEKSRAFVRKHGLDTSVMSTQWDRIHALQF